MEIIKMAPVFKEKIWGGNRLETEYGYELTSGKIGECWAVSAHTLGEGVVAEGQYKGTRLSDLWKEHRELFGGMDGEVFPLLTKLIDANDDLSVQVHPDDDYAKVHENGSLGKTECWYIIDCDEDATIVMGHNARTKSELESMIEEGRWNELLREVPIKKGDFFQINPGTIHAIKAGTLILETQQNCDITYRLYDYGRLENGKPRPLHIEKSLDVIKVPYEPIQIDSKCADGWMKELYSCKYYTVWKGDLSGTETLKYDQKFLIGTVLEGEAMIDGEIVKKGDNFILPFGYNDVIIKGEASFIFSAPNEGG